jgi:hypothetical protein
MKNKSEKPSPEAKALSLFLMAFKANSPVHKEQSKRINRLWSLVNKEEMSPEEYMEKVNSMLTLNGGYMQVIEKTVRYYIEKTGEWKLKGDDQYCEDAQKVADRILKK